MKLVPFSEFISVVNDNRGEVLYVYGLGPTEKIYNLCINRGDRFVVVCKISGEHQQEYAVFHTVDDDHGE